MNLRRNFLAFTAGAVVARTVLPMAAMAARVPQLGEPTPHPDATLLAVCAEAQRLAQAIQTAYAPSLACSTLIADHEAAYAAAALLPATTEAGRLAKVGLVRNWLAIGPDMDLPHWSNGQERLAWSLMDDLSRTQPS